jgi:CheY-like chemotaxis protein
MSALACQIVLVDHGGRADLWDAVSAAAPWGTLARQDAAPFADWGIPASAALYHVGEGCRDAEEGLRLLAGLTWCQRRLRYRADGPLQVILERPDPLAADVAAWVRALDDLLHAFPALSEADSDDTSAGHTPPQGLRLGRKPVVRSAAPAPSGPRTVVLVEDDRMVRSLCLRILQTQFLAVEADASVDALSLASRWPLPLPLLITDVNMPDMNGLTLAHLWLQRRPGSRVLLLSGDPHLDEPLPPTMAFLGKPFRSDELTKAVMRLLNGAEHNALA